MHREMRIWRTMLSYPATASRVAVICSCISRVATELGTGGKATKTENHNFGSRGALMATTTVTSK